MSAVVSEMLIRIAADTAALKSQMASAQRAVGDGFDGIKSAANGLRNTLVGVFAGISTVAIAKEFIATADAVALLDARLKNSVGTEKEFAAAKAEVYRIAQANNIGLKEATELYTKLNDPVKRLGGSTKETGGIVEAFALSLRLGGANANEASAATLQFAQAMASGKLSGDEFRSLAEASPVFMKKLADGMGVPIENLKKMGSEGKLTADVVGNALLKSLESMRGEATRLPDTVSGAFQRIKNDVIVAVGELNNNSGLTLGLSSLLETVRVQLLPAIKVELAGAFEAVGGWIEKNRDWIAQMWETAKGLVSQGWEAAKAFGSVVGTIAEVIGKSDAWRVVMESIRLLLAGLQDGFNVIRGAVLWLAGDKEGANAIFDAFKNGQSAVQQFATETNNAKARTEQLDAALKLNTMSAQDNKDEMARLGRQIQTTTGGFGKLRPAVAAVSEEQKKAEDAYRKLISGIQSKITATNTEIAQGEKLTDAQKVALKVMEDIRDGNIRLTDAQKLEVVALLEKYSATEKMLEKYRQEKELTDQIEKNRQDSIRELQSEATELWKKVEAQNSENTALTNTKNEMRLLEDARIDQQIAIYNQKVEQDLLTGVCNAETAAHTNILNALIALKEARATNVHLQAAKDSADEWKRTAETIEKGITDALMRGFDSGKSMFKALRDAVVDMFKSLVLRPIIQPIVGGLAGLFGGGPAFGAPLGGGGMAGGLNLMGMFQNLYSLINGTMLGNAAAFGAEGLGNWLMMNTSGSLNGLGGWLMGNSNLLGSLASYLGPGAIGVALGKLLGGNYRLGGLSSGSSSLIGAGIGALFGPLGALFGGSIGGLVNRMFGRKLDDYGIEGTFGKGDGFTGNAWEFYRGGWFRSDKTERKPLDADIGKFLTDTFNAIKGSVGDLVSSLGLDAKLLDGYTKDIKLSIKGLTDEQIKAELEKQFTKIRDEMLGLYADAIGQFAKEGETLEDTIKRLLIIQEFREAINPLGGIFSRIANASIDAQEELIALSGGIESFLKRANDFIKEYYTEEEQAAIAAKDIVDSLNRVGIDLVALGIDSKEEFRRLVESIDISTEKGRQQLAALLAVGPQFAQLIAYLNENSKKDDLAKAEFIAELRTVGIDLIKTGVDTVEEYRALMRSIDTSTEEGRLQYELLKQNEAAFIALIEKLEREGKLGGLNDLLGKSPQVEALRALFDPNKKTAENTDAISKSVEVSNKTLGDIATKLDGIANSSKAAADAAGAAASSASSAAAAAASAAAAAAAAAKAAADTGNSANAAASAAGAAAKAADATANVTTFIAAKPTFSFDIGAR